MAEKQTGGRFGAHFIYEAAILDDFEALYKAKQDTPMAMRIALGLLGGGGAAFFGWKLYTGGMQLMYIGYLLICSVLLVIAFSRDKGKKDDTPAKYRRAYQNRHATFSFDEQDFELRLEGQKSYARSKYKDVYSLCDTDRCFYLIIKGRAHYILPKASVEGGTAEEFRQYIEKKCGRKFQHYDLQAEPEK